MKYRTRTYYSNAQKAVMWERWKQGWTLHQIAHLFDRAHTSVRGVLAQTAGIRPPGRTRAAIALTLPEREAISRALAEGQSIRSIAGQLGRAPSQSVASLRAMAAEPLIAPARQTPRPGIERFVRSAAN